MKKNAFHALSFSVIMAVLNAFSLPSSATNKIENIDSIIDCMSLFNQHIIQTYESPEPLPIAILNEQCNSEIVGLKKYINSRSDESQNFDDSLSLQVYLDNSLTLKEKALVYSQSIDFLNQQIARRNPSVNLNLDFSLYSLNYLRCTTNAYALVGTVCSEVKDFEPYSKPQNYYQFGSTNSPNISLSYDLFNREKDMSIMSAKSNSNAQSSLLNNEFQDFSQKTLKKLDEISKAQQKVIIRKSSEMLYRKSLEIAENQLEIGFQTTVGVDKLKSSLAKSESQLINSVSDLQKKLSDFSTFTSSNKVQLENLSFISNKFSDLPIENPDSMIQSAIETNPKFQQIKYQLDQIGYQILAKKAKKYPTLSLSLGVGLEKTGIVYDSMLKTNSVSSQFTGTLGIRWDLYDSGLTKSLVGSEKKKLEKSKIQLEQLTLSTTNEIQSLVSQIRASNLELKERINAVKSSESAMRGTHSRMLAGFEDTTSLIQTVEQYITDQGQLVDSVYEGSDLYRQLAFISQNLSAFNTDGDIQKSFEKQKLNANSLNYSFTLN